MKLQVLTLALLATSASAAEALTYEDGRWFPGRHPGAAIPESVTPPAGWRLGGSLHAPYGAGLAAGYVWPGEPVAAKVGLGWQVIGDRGQNAFAFSDARVFGAFIYYLRPGVGGGPYIETGLGWVRSSGPLLSWPWPVTPHLGFGVTGRLDENRGWDMNFSATATGLLSLEGAILF